MKCAYRISNNPLPVQRVSANAHGFRAPAAPKVVQMLKAWSEKRAELAAGEISEEEYREWKSRF